MTASEKANLEWILDRIKREIIERSDVPIKAMSDYTVEDMVKLRGGYDMIKLEILELCAVFELYEKT